MTEIFGIPVSGDKQHSSQRYVEQYPLEDLRQVFLDLINDPNVVEFGWRQYTPYFNDGDVCEFGVSDPWLRTVDDVDADFDELTIGSYHPTLSDQVWREMTDEEYAKARAARAAKGWYGDPYRSSWFREGESKYPETAAVANKLSAIESGHYDRDLLDAFGDHCEVTVTKDGIRIDEYSHD